MADASRRVASRRRRQARVCRCSRRTVCRALNIGFFARFRATVGKGEGKGSGGLQRAIVSPREQSTVSRAATASYVYRSFVHLPFPVLPASLPVTTPSSSSSRTNSSARKRLSILLSPFLSFLPLLPCLCFLSFSTFSNISLYFSLPFLFFFFHAIDAGANLKERRWILDSAGVWITHRDKRITRVGIRRGIPTSHRSAVG